MRPLLLARWLILVNTLPTVLLLLLGYAQYSLIESLLPAPSRLAWGGLGGGVAGLALLTLGYAFYQQRRRQPVGLGYCALALLATIGWLALAIGQDQRLIPLDVPRWLVPTDVLLYAYTFLMPTLAHAVLVGVAILTPPTRAHSALRNFGLAFAIPIGWGMFSGLIGGFIPNWLPGGEWLWAVVFIGAVGAFLFFLVRAAYVMELGRQSLGKPLHLGWKIAVALVGPVLGLLVNSGLFLGESRLSGGVFGDFSSWWFYALAVLNAVVVCWPAPASVAGQRTLLLSRCLTLPYTVYFFLVFLPFLPLALPAVILIGTGFLLLTPLLLAVVHTQALHTSWQQLQASTPAIGRWALAVGGGLVLPLALTLAFRHHRHTLAQALAYRYTPDYQHVPAINEQALAYTLQQVRANKERGNNFLESRQMPYLSMYFNWLVLDNLTLSDAKLADLERVFIRPTTTAAASRAVLPSVSEGQLTSTADITRVSSRSAYDARQQAWVSQVELEVRNQNPRQQDGELVTQLALPAGCWVSDYYLDLNGRREHGILAEKKAAQWVYAQIRNEQTQRDPGLLAYDQPDLLRLRVYPVVGSTPRRTGFELLHREPVTLRLGKQVVQLGQGGSPGPPRAVRAAGGQVAYLSAAAKQALPQVRRRPYYHFLLDASAGAARAGYAASLQAQFGQAALRNSSSRFWLVDAYATPVPQGQPWQPALQQHTGKGGFYLEGALRQLLVQAYREPTATYPVPVVVTNDGAAAGHLSGLAELQAAFPETDQYYVLTAGQLTAHSLLKNRSPEPILPLAALPVARPVRAWPSLPHARAYLPNDTTAAVVLTEPAVDFSSALMTASRWETGLLLHGYEQWLAFHPEAAEARRVPFVQASFRSGILTAHTAYLALENKAQQEALRRKQQQVLRASSTLDLEEDPATAVPIDDYAGLLLVVGVGLALWQLRRPG